MGGHGAHSSLAMSPCHGNGISVTGDDSKYLGTFVNSISVVPEKVKQYALLRDGRGVDYQHPVVFGRIRKEHGERVNAVFIGY